MFPEIQSTHYCATIEILCIGVFKRYIRGLKNNDEVRLKIWDRRNEASRTWEVPDYLALPRGPCNASIETVSLVVRSRAGSPIAVPVPVVVGSEIEPGLDLPEWHGYMTCSTGVRMEKD